METAISIVSARKPRGGRFPESPCGRRGGLGMKRALLSATFGLALLPAAVFADTTWNGNVDGDFNTAGNWSNGVPTTKNAGVIGKTGENTISVSASPVEKVGAFSMSNADGATTLSVTAPMQFEEGTVTIGKNSEVVVGAGGEISALIPQNPGGNSDNVETSGIHNGGKLVVDGGVVALTNKIGHIALGGNDASDTGTIEINSGKFIYHYDKADNGSGWAFRLFPGGQIKMTGGEFETRCMHNITGFGGSIDLSGDAKMYFVDPEYNHNGSATYLLLRNLTMRMSGNSILRNVPAKAVSGGKAGAIGRDWRIDSWDSGQTALLEMSDNALLDVWGKAEKDYGGNIEIGIGDLNKPGSRGQARVSLRGNACIETGKMLILGMYGGSTGIVEIADNALITQNNALNQKNAHSASYGMKLGYHGRSAALPAFGVLKMSGGSVTLVSRVNLSNTRKFQPYGLVLGDGSDGDYDGNVSVGRIEMTGGVISNHWWQTGSEWAALMLGARSGRGEIFQSGGEIVHRGNLPVVIGFSGGDGLYDMAGGELKILESPSAKTQFPNVSNIYVGGASIADAGYDPTVTTDAQYATWAEVEYGGRLATGTLVVSGGVVRTVGSVYVSSHGYGTLEIGKAGRIEAANLYLTNSTVNGVTAPAKLKVTLGPNGCGKIALTGKCQIASDAQCEIDVSAFEPTEKGQTISFLECASVEGGFAAANVSVTGPGRSSYRLVATETGLSVKYNSVGLMIFVR